MMITITLRSHNCCTLLVQVVVCQLEVPQEATLAALQCAKQHSCTTVFNPAPAAATLLPGILEVLLLTTLHYTTLM
jgi:sugar/nucleoside kinase (ribokinase family)